MRSRRPFSAWTVALAAAACLCTEAEAQTVRSLQEGTRVRVELEHAARRVVALVHDVRPDTLVLARPGMDVLSRMPFAITEIKRLEISGGRRRLTVLGTTIGLLTGSALVGAYNSIVQSQCTLDCPDRFPLWIGAAVGATTFGVGFHFLRAERWHEITLPRREGVER